jgi:hypothetical protein
VSGPPRRDTPVGLAPERILVETWAPDYGSPFAIDEEREPPPVDLRVETAGTWSPLEPDAPPADDVLFIDGVQRRDAQVTFVEAHGSVPGLAGSFAAGAVRHHAGRAAVERVEVRRGLFTRGSSIRLECGGVSYEPFAATDTSTAALSSAMTEQMRALEKWIASEAAAQLVVIDGPLSGGRNVPGAVGVIKTHRQGYLPEEEQAVVAALGPGQRTPLFLTKTDFSRYSWYQRLPDGGATRSPAHPGPAHPPPVHPPPVHPPPAHPPPVHPPPVHPWSGVVRCEVSETNVAEARRLAGRCAATLPRFASSGHRDPRAPQNLTPIGFLEQHLRHRLGDAAVLERLLRRACHAWRPAVS